MKKNIFLFCVMLAIGYSSFAQVDRSKRPEATEEPIFKIGDYETFTLDNGLKVFLVEDHTTPIVRFSLSLTEVKPIYEGEKAGFVSLSGDLMMRGTSNRTKDELNEEIDFIGASLNTSGGGMAGRCMTTDLDKFLDITRDVLLNPIFPEEELEKLIKQYKASLASSRPQAGTMLSKVKNRVIYGTDTPFGEMVTEFTLDKVTVNDCKNYYKTYWRPNVSYLTIIGDITLEQAKKKVEEYFGSWEKADVPEQDVKTPAQLDKGFVAFVNKTNAKQSVIDITNTLELEPFSEDYEEAMLMNGVLGGSGFNSRLFQNLREDKGYTYGAYSSLSPSEYIGIFNCGASVRNEVTDSALTQFVYELKRIRDEKVSDEELELSRKIMTGSFALSLENSGIAASFASAIERYDLPKDYFDNYVERVNSVTADDVQKAAQKYVQPDKIVYAVAGNEEEVREDLEKWAKENNLDFKRFESEDGEEIIPVDPSIPEGMTAEKIVAKYIEVIGGEENIKQIKSLVIDASNFATGREIELNEVRKMPGKLATSMLSEGKMVYRKIYNGVEKKGFYLYTDKDEQALRRQLYDASLEVAKREAVFFDELYFDYFNYKLKLEKKTEVVNNEVCYVVRIITPEGNRFRKYYSKRTGLLVQFEDHNRDTYIYDKYRWVEGVKMPFLLKYTTPIGQIDIRVNSIKVNQNISDQYFKVD